MRLEWIFTAILAVYFSLIIYRTLQPLARLRRARGSVREIPGIVWEHESEETVAAAGEKVRTAFPVYSCMVDGAEKRQTGYVRLAVSQREKGSAVTLIYEPGSKILCCKEDIPLMKKAAARRTAFLLVLLFVVAVAGLLP